MKKIIFIALILGIAVYAIAATSVKPLKKQHEGLACVDCHGEKAPTVSVKVSCVSCHGSSEDMAKVTADKYKQYYNPHDPLHYGTNALCESCHREHTPSKLECNNPNCHSEFKYLVP